MEGTLVHVKGRTTHARAHSPLKILLSSNIFGLISCTFNDSYSSNHFYVVIPSGSLPFIHSPPNYFYLNLA